MANVTDGEKQSTTQEFFCETGFEARQKMLILISSFPLAVVAFLGNAVIIAALRNVSTLHPSSKILLVCLACTDLGVGLISHPLLIGYLMSEGHLKICSYLGIFFYTIGFTLCGVSLLTLTAISVDRLLALLLRLRYKDVVTVKRARILVVAIWLVSPSGVVVVLYNFRCWSLFCCSGTVRSNLYPLLHKNLSHPSPSPNPSARTDSPRKTAWERDSTQDSALQKDSVQCAVGANNFAGLLPSISNRGIYIFYQPTSNTSS